MLAAATNNVGAPVNPIVVTSPVNVIRANPGGNCSAGVVFQTDGGLDLIGPGLATFVAYIAGQYHISEPLAGLGAGFDVRCASISSGSWTTAAAATGSWVNMGTQRSWRVTVAGMASPALQACTAIFEIRIAGGGATLATFTVVAQASN